MFTDFIKKLSSAGRALAAGLVGLDRAGKENADRLNDLTMTTRRLGVTNKLLAEQMRSLLETRAELEKNKENFQAFFDALDTIVVVLDISGRIIRTNPAVQRKLGFSRPEVEGLPFAILFPKERRIELSEALMRASRDRFSRTDTPLKVKGGGAMPAETTIMRGRWSSAEAFFAVSRDLTELKKAEEGLLQSELKFKKIAEVSPAGFWLASPGLKRFLYISPAFESIHEMPAAELSANPQRWAELIHPDDRADAVNALSMNWPETLEQEYRIITPKGRVKWVRAVISPIFSRAGEVIFLSGYCEDVTARRNLMRAMRESEVKYSTLVENAREGVSISCGGRIVFINSAGAAMLGRDRSELLEKSLEEFAAPGEREALAKCAGEVLDGKPGMREFQMLHKDGGAVFIEISADKIAYKGQPAVMCIGRDVTARKRMEEEIIKARDAAESASRAKAEFIANMSHEIRTPLNAITGMAELLAGTALTSDQREFVSAVSSAAEHLLGVVNDILDFSQIEAGARKLKVQNFAPRETVSSTCKMFSARAAAKGLNFECAASNSLPLRLSGDPNAVRQIIVNLVVNAIKFTNSGTVRVQAGYSDAAGAAGLTLDVTDTGIGMSPGETDKAFERFRQVDGSYTRRYGGTGLGLSLTKSLVDLAGGKIWVESQKGEGSAFHVLLPFARAQEKLQPAPSAPPAIARTGHGRVLVVEDNAINLRLAGLMLSKAGYEVDTAINGLLAVELARENRYSAILMDIHMPVMDGSTAVVEIRRHEAERTLPRTPVIALTADATPQAMEYCRRNGMDDYIVKPVHGQTLLDTLAKWTEQQKSGQGPQTPPPAHTGRHKKPEREQGSQE